LPALLSRRNDHTEMLEEGGPELVDRQTLTAELVNAITPPKHGERWIADTEIPGFGLRLWATSSGEGKAFAIRTFTHDHKIIRRTFNPRGSWEYSYALFLSLKPDEIGSYLNSARRWAWHGNVSLVIPTH
jgi:hypothetical protein